MKGSLSRMGLSLITVSMIPFNRISVESLLASVRVMLICSCVPPFQNQRPKLKNQNDKAKCETSDFCPVSLPFAFSSLTSLLYSGGDFLPGGQAFQGNLAPSGSSGRHPGLFGPGLKDPFYRLGDSFCL